MESNKGLISVIIPVYNRQDVIEKCVRSVFAQSYQKFEIVIVDDGSTDHTYDLCKIFADNDSRVKLFRAEHGGVSSARNTAIDAASGEYLFFLDSDDAIHSLLLETLVTNMESSGAAIGGTHILRIRDSQWDKTLQELASESIPGDTNYVTFEQALDITFTKGSPLSCIGGVMIRRDVVGNTRFRTDLHIGEDFYFVYENLIKGCACVFLVPRWYYVRINNQNSSWDFSFRGFWSRFYRRELVWKSEEQFGRQKYADKEKRSAFDCFVDCVSMNKPFSLDSKGIRKVGKRYRKILFPALTGKQKIKYILYLYFPALISRLRKKKHKKQRRV